MKILHLDFSDFYRSLVEKECQSLKIDYIGVKTEEEFFEALDHDHPDVILTSLGLKSFFKDFIFRIQKTSGGQLVPIFVLSSNKEIPQTNVLFKSGLVGAFSKEDSPDSILKYIIDFMKPQPVTTMEIAVAVVEDSLLERKLIVRYLNQIGLLHIDEFSDADGLLNSENEYDLFVIDYVLESGTAEELIRKIRNRFSETQVLVISGMRKEAIAVRVLDLGADDFLHKPFGFELFRARIRSQMRNLQLIREIEGKRKQILKVHQNLLNGIEVARELQSGWIPTYFSESEKIRICGAYQPMEELGGDFYDYYKIDEDHYYFLMTDVSGHGVSSALITSMLKLVFQNDVQTIAGPDLMMMTLNRSLYHSIGNLGYFVTSVCLYLNLEERSFSLACAGHPDILWQRGEVIKRVPGGKRDQILGFSSTVLYQTWNDKFLSGDRFFLYTDGVTETTNTDLEMFEIERLEKFLIQHKDTPVHELKQLLLKYLDTFRGNQYQDDDITFVVIEVGTE